MIPVNRLVFATALGLLPHVLLRTCLAQESTKPVPPASERNSERDFAIKAITLKNAEAESVASAIKKLGFQVAVAVTGAQSIVLRGPAADVQSVVETLIAALDVPGVGDGSGRSPQVIPVRHYPIKEVGGLVRSVAQKASLAIDETRHTIVVDGTEEEKRAIREVLKQIDWPTRSAKVHLYFLRGAIGGATPEKELQLPADLLPIGKTLAQNGFGRLSLIAPIVIGVEEGQHFESNSRLHLGEEAAGHDDLQFNVYGVARLASGADDAWLTLRGRMVGKYSRTKDADTETVFELDTSVATKLGNYVILAAAPSSTASGDAVALVVRLTAE